VIKNYEKVYLNDAGQKYSNVWIIRIFLVTFCFSYLRIIITHAT